MKQGYPTDWTVIKRRIFLIMGRPNQKPLNQFFNSSLVFIIFINVCAVVLETVPSLHYKYEALFYWIEFLSVSIFSIEYLLRLWVCSVDEQFGPGLKGKIKYLFSFFAIIDLLAILPSIISMISPVDFRMLRALRLFRLVRLLKLARYSLAIYTLVSVFKRKKPELLISTSLGFILILVSSSLMYIVEHDAQPEKYSSIPATMWWATSTLTTIGYGDVYPVTDLGRFLGSIIAFLGVGLFALPAAILATGFAEVYNEGPLFSRPFQGHKECPTCRQNLPQSKKAPMKKVA